jgi:hypothetical protein
MVNWLVQDAIPTLLMKGVNPEDVPYRWGARVLMLLILLAIVLMVRAAWKNREKTKLG